MFFVALRRASTNLRAIERRGRPECREHYVGAVSTSALARSAPASLRPIPLQQLRAVPLPQPFQRVRFDLPDPLARELDLLRDLLQRRVRLLADAEALPEHVGFARAQRCQRAF